MDDSSRAQKRRKKVYYSYRPSTSRLEYKKSSGKLYPVIYLAGNYLAESDFKIGDVIEVDMKPGKIVITKAPLCEE